MRTFLQHLGRDTEHNLLSVITSFLRTPLNPDEYLDLRVFMRKRRHIGKIYLEHVVHHQIHRRYYFCARHWQRVRSMEAVWATSRLKEARSLLRVIGESVEHLNNQIELCENYYEDIKLSHK